VLIHAKHPSFEGKQFPAYTSQRNIQRQMALDIQEGAAMHSNTKEVISDVDTRLETPSSASDGDVRLVSRE